MLLCLVLALLLNHKTTADLWLAEELREQPATSASAVLVWPALAWIRSLDILPRDLLHPGSFTCNSLSV